MAQVRSQFVVEVATRGAAQAKNELAQLERQSSGAADKQKSSLADAAKSMARMNRLADQLIGKFSALDKALQGFATSSRKAASATGQIGARRGGMAMPASQAALAAAMSGAGADYTNPKATITGAAARATGAGGAAVGAAPQGAPGMRPGAFLHGLFQGLLPGNLGFVQRGPGAVAQGAGMMAGNVASSLMSIPFAGAQGLAGAGGALGSIVSSPLSRFMGRAEEAVSFQRQQMSLMPLLAGAGRFDASQVLPDSEASARAIAYADKVAPKGSKGRESAVNRAYDRLNASRSALTYQEMERQGAPGRDLMGVSLAEQQSFYAQVAASGASTAQGAGSRFLGLSMAANTSLGMSPQTSGAFALGARTNAFAGGGKDATAQLLDAINQTRSLGLEGADAQQYLSQMAEGIRQFQTSGMPLQKDSIFSITRGLTGFGGMGSLQAQQAAAGLTASSQRFMDQGPTSSLELAMMQKQGFKGGVDSYLSTKRRLGTDSTAFASSMMETLPMLASSSSREVNIEEVRRALASENVSRDPRVAEQVVDDMRRNGGRLSKNFRKLFTQARDTSSDLSYDQVLGTARGAVPEAARNAATMQNQGIVMGSDAAAISQELEAAANDTAQIVSRFASGLMKMAKAARSITGNLTGSSSAAAPSLRPSN